MVPVPLIINSNKNHNFVIFERYGIDVESIHNSRRNYQGVHKVQNTDLYKVVYVEKTILSKSTSKLKSKILYLFIYLFMLWWID